MIVVVGLGNLGLALASRFDRTLGDTVGVDPDVGVRAAFEETGGRAEADLEQLDWDQVRRVVVVVRTIDQARAVVDEVARRSGTARIYIVTTLDPAAAIDLGTGPASDRVLETPISGGSDGALAGTLTVMVSGPTVPEDIAFLEGTVAGRVIAFDQRGEATFAKLLNNAVMAVNTLVVSDAVRVAGALGLDPGTFLDLLSASSGGSRAATKFSTLDAALLEKDARLLLGSTDALGEAETLAPLIDRATSLSSLIAPGRQLVEDAD